MAGRILWQSADGVYRAVGKSKAFTDPRAVASGIKIQVASNSIVANLQSPVACNLRPYPARYRSAVRYRSPSTLAILTKAAFDFGDALSPIPISPKWLAHRDHAQRSSHPETTSLSW